MSIELKEESVIETSMVFSSEQNITNDDLEERILSQRKELAIEQQKIKNQKMTKVINEILDRKLWIQTKIARVLDISQPRVSKLRRGEHTAFSGDFLERILIILGYEFSFEYSNQAGKEEIDIKINVSKI